MDRGWELSRMWLIIGKGDISHEAEEMDVEGEGPGGSGCAEGKVGGRDLQ